VADAPLKLEEFLAYRLYVAGAFVSDAFARLCTQPYGLGNAEWRVLMMLGQSGRMTNSAMSARGHMSRTKVTRAVAVLDGHKLITRSPSRQDYRSEMLALTAAGRGLYEQVAAHSLDFGERLIEAVDAADRPALHRALDRLMGSALDVTIEGRTDKAPAAQQPAPTPDGEGRP
jgi:DNA-binding MarR family transcriptional regulator